MWHGYVTIYVAQLRKGCFKYGFLFCYNMMVHQKTCFSEFQSEASEEGDQLGKVFFHAAKLRGTYILHVLLFNGTFHFCYTIQMVNILVQSFQDGPFISAAKKGTKCFNGGLIFFGPGGLFCYVTEHVFE